MADAESHQRLTYHVEMTLPSATLDSRLLHEKLHRSDRHVGVVSGGRDGGLYLGILTGAESADAARSRALQLINSALESLGHAELAPQVEVVDVTGQPASPGKPRLLESPPSLSYRKATLPDGRVLRAACAGPLGDWFAFMDDSQGKAMAGRSLPGVLSELLALPWGTKDPWFHKTVAVLAGHSTGHGVRYQCPCCDHLTLQESPPGTHATCAVCRWEDDSVQFHDPDYRGGANRVSLREARRNFARHGKCDPERGGPVRAPRRTEQPPRPMRDD